MAFAKQESGKYPIEMNLRRHPQFRFSKYRAQNEAEALLAVLAHELNHLKARLKKTAWRRKNGGKLCTQKTTGVQSTESEVMKDENKAESIPYQHHDSIEVSVYRRSTWRTFTMIHGETRKEIALALLNNHPHKLILWGGLAAEFEVSEKACRLLEQLQSLKKPITHAHHFKAL